MATIEDVIFAKLTGAPTITTAVGQNVFPEFRDDVSPSLCYAIDTDQVDGTYDVTGPVAYELIVTVAADTLAQASAIADVVIALLDRADEWTDRGLRVLGCFWRDRHKSLPERASKNKRLGTVDLYFDLDVDGPSVPA